MSLMLRLVCLLLLGCMSVPALAQPETQAAARPRIVGYVANGEQLPDIDARKLDVINFAFTVVGPDHRVRFPDALGPKTVDGLVRLRKRNPDLKIVLSIGGWGAGHFSEAAATVAARQAFTDSAMALLRRHDVDGLDVDWEYPTLADAGISASPADRDNFTALLRSLRNALDAQGKTRQRHYLLTIAAAEGRFAAGLDLPKISPLLDWINLMTYDFYGSATPTTGHSGALYPSSRRKGEGRSADEAVRYFVEAGVPAAKLHLGMAFYGRRFGDVQPAQQGLLQPYASDGGFISYRRIVDERLTEHGFERHWDDSAQAAWLWNPKTAQMISYDDPQALRAKVEYVRRHGLGGVMFWEYREDHGEDLLDVVGKALDAPAPAGS
jgi:chitinase